MQKEIENSEKGTELLLKVFQLEKLIRKYKVQLSVILILIVGAVIGVNVKSYIDEQQLIKTNEAYNRLLQNPNDKKALEILKENRKLYNLYLLKTGADDIKKLEEVAKARGIVGNIAEYQIASLKGDIKSLENYSLTIGAIHKDLANLNLVRLYLAENNYKKAEETAKLIEAPNLAQIADGLLHYGIVK
jgi:hypothetical protein